MENNYTTGIAEFDKIVKFVKGNFVVIAARAGVGKTCLMLKFAVENALNENKSLFLSFEMTAKSINKRIINMFNNGDLEVDNNNDDGNINIDSYKKAFEFLKNTKDYKKIDKNLNIAEFKNISIDSFISSIESQIDEMGYEAIFIDYLQFLIYNSNNPWESSRKIMEKLNELAFRKNVLIVVTFQISNQGDISTSIFAHSIHYYADIIIHLERNINTWPKSIMNINILKNRSGETGSFCITDYTCGK